MSSQRKRFGKTRRHFSRRMPAFSLPGSTPSRTIYQLDPSVIASRYNSYETPYIETTVAEVGEGVTCNLPALDFLITAGDASGSMVRMDVRML